MKTWQMIKELTENPNKRFKLKDEELYLENIDGEVNLGEIYWFRDDDRWEEVKKRIDFMTAVKSGKKIGVEYYKIHYRNMTLPDLFYQLQQHYSDTTIKFIILRGKWYIED